MEQTITECFLENIIDFSCQEFPRDIVQTVKNCLKDYMACSMMGSFLLEEKHKDFLKVKQHNTGIASVIGLNTKTNVLTAALLNGIQSHFIELDDGHRFGMLHPGAPNFSALLAVAQDRNISFQAFIRGIIVGYESTIRLAEAIQPGHKLRGYHATGTCATVGAALGIASALGYEPDKWNSVISAAATDSAGLLQVIDDGSELKPYNIGRAAVAAINAAYYGKLGLKGPTDVIGGKRGFLKTLSNSMNLEYLLKDWDRYAINGIYRKPYAACRHTHSAIESVLNIQRKYQIAADDIESVMVNTYGLAVYGHDHKEISGAGSAKMSIPYSVACAIVFGNVNYDRYSEECLSNPSIQKLLPKISVAEDAELSKLVPEKRSAIVLIRTKNGEYSDRVDYPLGEPENPMTEKDLDDKFYSLMYASGKSRDYSDRILFLINNLETSFNDFLLEL